MLTTKQCILLLSFVSTSNLLPALITKADASLSTEALVEFHRFSELPGGFQTSVALYAIDAVEQPSTKKWIAQSRQTNRQFNAIFSKTIKQAPVIFERLQPDIDAALLASNFDTNLTMFPTLNDTLLSKIIAKIIIKTNVFYTQQIAQGNLLPSFCAADPQKKPLFFYPNFGCHLISCCTVDQNAQQQETSDANLNLLLAHTKSHDPYGQEIIRFIEHNTKNISPKYLVKLTKYISKFYEQDTEDLTKWNDEVVNKTITVVSEKNDNPEDKEKLRNTRELANSALPNTLIDNIMNNHTIKNQIITLCLMDEAENITTKKLRDFVILNFSHIIDPCRANPALDDFILYLCTGIYFHVREINSNPLQHCK